MGAGTGPAETRFGAQAVNSGDSTALSSLTFPGEAPPLCACHQMIPPSRPALRAVLSGIIKWNVDEHDIDNVLRIETAWLLPQDIIRLVNGAGYICEELPD